MEAGLAGLVALMARGNPEVTAALVVDASGQVQASEAVAPEVARAAVAMVVPLRDFLDRAAADLGCGVLRATVVEGSEATFALADVDGDRTAIVIGASGAAIGSIRADSLWLAEELRSLGGAS
jgi:predicted regulator of Ras-like GTPase activity (Roadblock/LC7/MglB family)